MPTDHVKMLCDISELNSLFEENNLEGLLNRIVKMVAGHLQAEVCSIYLYNEKTDELVLKATVGLNIDAVDRVSLKPGEGIVGSAFYDMQAICEKCGPDNPCFKSIKGINEELFESYLAVPLLRGSKRIGVISVQRKKESCFDELDSMALKATASQLASMLEYIQLLLVLQKDERSGYLKPVSEDFSKYQFLKGKSASKGWVYSTAITSIKNRSINIILSESKGNVYTIGDFDDAVRLTEEQLELMQKKVEEKLSDAASLIFEAHLLILKDQGFVGGIRSLISEGIDPFNAVYKILKKYSDLFSKSENRIIQEKVQDIEDLSFRILDNMIKSESLSREIKDQIIISGEIYPSDLLRFSAEEAAGIINISGGITSHLSILARSLGIPMIYIDKPDLLKMPEGTKILMDADIGNIYINPGDDIVKQFREKDLARSEIITESGYLTIPSSTADGKRIKVMVNVNLLSDVLQVGNASIDGVGLYRTEFPFIIRSNFPSEEEQFVIYGKLINDMKGNPVVFRTLDIGGDKVLSYYQGAKEENPFLGLRSIRFSLLHKEIFRQQIRAILRAGSGSDIRIMFPMISSIEEFIQSRSIVEEEIGNLEEKGVEFKRKPKIGLMVEIPSAVAIIEELASEADFLSVGTNDLIQYTLAVDRTNEKVAELYIPHHPAILRSLKTIAIAAEKSGISVSVCGDMANNAKYIPFLLGIGVDSFSVDALYLPRVKKTISSISLKDAREIADEMLSGSTIAEIEKALQKL